MNQVTIVKRENHVSNFDIGVHFPCRVRLVDLCYFFRDSFLYVMDQILLETRSRREAFIILATSLLIDFSIPVVVSFTLNIKPHRVVPCRDCRDVPLQEGQLSTFLKSSQYDAEEHTDQASCSRGDHQTLILLCQLFSILYARVLDEEQIRLVSALFFRLSKVEVFRAELDVVSLLANGGSE